LTALFVSVVGLTIIQSNMIEEEELCKKLELIEVNIQDLTEGNSTNTNRRNRKLGLLEDINKNFERS
jgi:hypothetical protein